MSILGHPLERPHLARWVVGEAPGLSDRRALPAVAKYVCEDGRLADVGALGRGQPRRGALGSQLARLAKGDGRGRTPSSAR